MNNIFITQYFDWDRPEPKKVRLANAFLERLGYGPRLVSRFRTGDMTNVEQRINMFHLVEGVLFYGVPGELVELGSHSGVSASLIQKVIEHEDPSRRLHVYDAFENPSADVLLNNFQTLGLQPPVVHAGWFEDTLPDELPETIAFAHIDVGPSKSAEHFEQTIFHGLECLYPRMSRGAVCLLADYCDPSVYEQPETHFPNSIRFTERWHLYPQVKRAADTFLADKPEKVDVLYSECYSHGYFRKR